MKYSPLRILILSIALFFVYGQQSFAQEQGWQADPDRIEYLEEERPQYNWRESAVPDFQLPDALEAAGGSKVQTKEQWQQRRSEILNQFRTHMYGHRPGPPENLSFDVVEEDPEAMDGRATLRRVAINSQHEGRSHEFELILFLPNEAPKPVPVFLLMNNRDPDNTDPTREEKSGFWPAEEVIDRGYGIAAIQNGDLAPDDEEHYHEGVIRLFEGEQAAVDREPDAWMALAAWGWGASRVMDYFEIDSRVDTSRVAVLGHSRGGKASLWAGAEDERFSIVISNNSGSGGAALSRRAFGETLRAVNRFRHWFAGNYDAFDDREEALPFDQHMLLSLIAPRAVYVASADEDLWADPRGEFLSLVHASPVYALWGHEPIRADEMPPLDQPLVAGPRGYHVRSGGHNLTPQDWHYYMDFADHLWR
ncbi:acetylxylan esterase [Fodinibius sp.]|uniref:glucuronyl esterase domain-containing protein n=1 Tax=Fodinibius sp. TaxID=1872440 RepID=UPI0035621045